MKKLMFALLLFAVVLIPKNTYASEITIANKKYEYKNLEETLKEVGIEKSYADYEENDDQVTIYLFRGKDCEYCEEFLKFLNNNLEEYGKAFKLVSFEVYENKNNNALLNKVADYIGAKGEGIPFVVIGNQYFEGYDSNYNKQILDAINKIYVEEVKDRPDIVQSLNKQAKMESAPTTEFKVIAWNFIFFVISTCSILFFVNYKINKLDEKVSLINNKGKH